MTKTATVTKKEEEKIYVEKDSLVQQKVAVKTRKRSNGKASDSKRKKEKKQAHNQKIGKKGEDAALRFLERKGFEILDRNWICPAGEADIIAEEDDCLVFIEVKTRHNCDLGFPEEAVDSGKRARYEKIAGYYLSKHDISEKCIRFDVISLLIVAPERAFLRHHRDAFGFDY